MVPANRQQFKEYCLRQLGSPVIDIEVDNDQIEDRIDEALTFFREYHYSGTERTFLKHEITATDVKNRYIEVNDTVFAINRVFGLSDTLLSGSNLFNVQYEITLNDLYNFTSESLVPYYLAQRHYELLDFFFARDSSFRFNLHTNKLYIDTNWDENLVAGGFVVADAYVFVDPATYTSLWGERWLQRYCTALIKKQWGSHLKKFTTTLPGGMQVNGEAIYSEAIEEIGVLEEKMIRAYSLPADVMIG